MLALELSFYLVVFVAAIFAFDVIMEFAGAVQNARQLAANRRARLLAEGATSVEALRRLTGGRSRVAGEEGGGDRLAAWSLRLEDALRRAGVNWTPMRFAQIVALVAAGIALALFFVVKLSVVASIVIGVVGGLGAAGLFLLNRERARKAKMAEQLPDVVDMIVRSLQAGHPIRAALSTVANDAADPMGSEIGITVDEMTFGLELEEALENLRRRVAIPDLDYMVVAINIHSRTGGNLAEILSNLSGVIRDRYRLFKKVRALSAEGRLSAYVISAVPFVIGLILGLNVPNYYEDAAKHPSFLTIALVAIGLYAVAIAAIWRIIKIRV
jgi:tight adherence protein B